MCSSHVYEAPTKKLQAIMSDEDRISNLPNGIIGHILSRLPTKDALRTSVLSQDWRYKWTSIYHIDIRYTDIEYRFIKPYCREGRVSNFISFMDRLLDATHNLRIRRFHLYCDLKDDSNHLETWISAILSRGIQDLAIDAFRSRATVLPRCFVDCTSLVNLKLTFSRCTLEVPVKSCFPNLKSLYLDGLSREFHIMNHQFPDNGQMVLNFPVLEVLELRHCRFLNVKSVEIWAPELVIFKTRCLYEYVDYEIKISGPKLAKFYSSGGILNHFVLCAPSLYNIDLTHISSARPLEILASRVLTIFKGAPRLKCLELSHIVVRALVQGGRGFVLPTFDQLRRLKLNSCSTKELLELLHAMPHLECLYLNMSELRNYKYDREKPLPLCIGSRLKDVRLIKFCGESSQIDLAKLFLENAKNLEKLFVYLNYTPRATGIEINHQLLTLAPKSSISITVKEVVRQFV